jgi:hypothetical protein
VRLALGEEEEGDPPKFESKPIFGWKKGLFNVVIFEQNMKVWSLSFPFCLPP